MRIPLFHVDAFTDHAFGGNPAAVCFLDGWLDDTFLRKVAAENNLPATAFLVPSADGYDLRWFTPLDEINLCGHGTLAAAAVVLQLQAPELEVVRFFTRFRGDLTVRKHGEFLLMDFPALDAKPCAEVPDLLHALASTTVEGLFEGNQSYVALLPSQAAIQNLRPDFALLEKLHPHVVVVTAAGEDVDFVSRYFAPGYGLPEDQVTGSAHCLLTPFWAKRLGKTKLTARQLSDRAGEMSCELAGDRVILKGKAVHILEGSLAF
jgi:PhzF family phenazine biosynthesis protein